MKDDVLLTKILTIYSDLYNYSVHTLIKINVKRVNWSNI